MKFFKKNLLFSLLILVFVLSLFLRFYKLDSFPVGFHQDEAALGYNAYSLLLTGKSENGDSWPLYIDTFGDFRPTGYNYLAMAPVAILGLNEFATRLPSSLFGALSVFAIFFVSYALFKNKWISLISALILAIAPWHLTISRASAETIIALFFIMVGFGAVFRSIEKRSLNLLTLGTISLSASFFFYHTPRVFVPMLFFAIIIFTFNFIKKSKFIKETILSFLIVSFISVILVFTVSGGTGRFTQVNIFQHPETRLVTEEEIREDGIESVPAYVARSFHNKAVNYTRAFFTNYFDYFDGKFLFIEGGLPMWYKVPHSGLLYLIEFPFLFLGLFYLFKKNDFAARASILWIFLAPVVAAITFDDVPNIQRSIVLFPMLNIISAFGIYHFIENKRNKKLLYLALGFIFFLSLLYYFHQYYVHSKVHRPWFRNVGVEEMVEIVRRNYADYDKVIVTKTTGGIYQLILFYIKFDPQQYIEEGSQRNEDYKGFGKFVFVPQDCPSVNRDSNFPEFENAIFVDKGECPLVAGQNYEIVHRPDGTPAYRVVYEN